MPDDKTVDLETWHRRLNAPGFVGANWFRRNAAQYSVVTSVNHIVAAYYSERFDLMALFAARTLNLLSEKHLQGLPDSYTRQLREYLELVSLIVLQREDVPSDLKDRLTRAGKP